MRIECLNKAIALAQQAMSNDKPLRVYALFLRVSARRSLDTVWDNAKDDVYAELL
ncbi:hypothetical protein PQG02_23840 [Nostoc sp. UHCC 0926]|uniref:hypothetical protein n=1 Tax=unclassified Nostoc TaxID=2593658 RepID=UPI0023603067|nr:hypothetical protein [Nostoc sp. UHCC 0926]WDD31698.1 hypothetical protein PQG02_23840 [Nostoc sp. UHCC 0926]